MNGNEQIPNLIQDVLDDEGVKTAEDKKTEEIGEIYAEDAMRINRSKPSKKPNLDYYDNRIDKDKGAEVNYEGKFGKFKKD